MIGHVSMLREFYEHFIDFTPGRVGLGDCESLPTHLKNERIIAEKVLVRRCLAIQHALEMQELGNVNWIPRLGNPADGLTKTKSNMVPLLRLLVPGV